MKISTKGRYALRVMLDLAQYGKETHVSLTDISVRQGLSLKYSEAIVASLSKADFLDSRRGKSGGYRLNQPPEQYTVRAILAATEGSLSPVSCLESGETCPRAEECLTLPLWRALDGVIDKFLENITLLDVLNGTIPTLY